MRLSPGGVKRFGRMAVVAGASLAALTPSPGESVAHGSAAFVFLSEVGGLVGGLSTQATSWYVGSDGLVQVSRETTDGRLLSLCEGHADGPALAEIAATLPSAMPEKARRPAPADLVSEYYPPHVSIAYRLAGRDEFAEEYDPELVRTHLAAFERRLEDVAGRTARSLAKPGLYARAQRLVRFDPNIGKLDGKLTVERSRSLPRLASTLAAERALVFLAEGKDAAVLFDGAAVSPDHPLHLQIGSRYFLILAYRLEAGKGEAAKCP